MARNWQGMAGITALLLACSSGNEAGSSGSADGGGCAGDSCEPPQLTSTEQDVGLALRHIAMGDVTGDGKIDAVATIDSSARNQLDVEPLVLFRGRGDGTFDDPEHFALPGSPTALKVADMTGDSVDDVVVFVPPEGWWVVPADGDGAFASPRQWSAPVESPPYDNLQPGPQAVLLDASGDGVVDIVAAPDTSSPPPVPSPDEPEQPRSLAAVVLLLGTGSGSLDRAVSSPLDPSDPRWSSTGIDAIARGDVDDDGKTEVVLLAQTAFFRDHPARPESEIGPLEMSAQELYVLHAEGNSLTQNESPEPLDSDASQIAVGDFDGDGRDDVVSLTTPAVDLVSVDLDGDGALERVTLTEREMLIQPGRTTSEGDATVEAAPGELRGVAGGDLDGDGLPELVSTYQIWKVVEQDARKRTLEAGGLWVRSPSSN